MLSTTANIVIVIYKDFEGIADSEISTQTNETAKLAMK